MAGACRIAEYTKEDKSSSLKLLASGRHDRNKAAREVPRAKEASWGKKGEGVTFFRAEMSWERGFVQGEGMSSTWSDFFMK